MNFRSKSGCIVLWATIATGGCSSEGTSTENVARLQENLVSGAGEAILSNTSTWANGYCADVRITNKGTAPITDWTVVVDTKQSSIYNIWNGTRTTSGSLVTVKPVAFNKAIAVGANATFGFCANKTGTNYQAVVSSLRVVGGSSTGVGGATSTGGTRATGGTPTGGAATGGAPPANTFVAGPCITMSPSWTAAGSLRK